MKSEILKQNFLYEPIIMPVTIVNNSTIEAPMQKKLS